MKIYNYAVGIKGDWKNIAYFKTKEDAEKYIEWNKKRCANMEVRKLL